MITLTKFLDCIHVVKVQKMTKHQEAKKKKKIAEKHALAKI